MKTARLALPALPENLEWVVHAESDRFTVNLSHRPVFREINPDVDQETDKSYGKAAGYVMSHTHRHPAVITREEWEREVVNAASHLWTHYTEGNKHAVWADELMRESQ